ncbi:GH32 C-terminal domain-containing protein [Liquorilactobacillus satsumensis]|uniref:GH32 C-terminal domain-containing protein n=1 Tax=Liquorilactobacillus satsumensis TaxID=259059 RepID=UPI001E562BD5|nr:GH32 C-terminal domain-containing protein [Liquorilactobacillus satsumensis]MCC7667236.1 glycoside hydrolase [Liquorilactobacillus satsumensis]
MTNDIFYRPTDGFVGDVIPFTKNGEAYLFFLFDERKEPKTGMPWKVIKTKDYAALNDLGIALPSGGLTAKDYNCYTGSVVTDEQGTDHLFYTGNNPHTTDTSGRSLQLIMHATSTDNMLSWTRHQELTFGASSNYEKYDWRDPFVFRDEENGVWRMIFAARKNSGPERRRGVTAQYISKDLNFWKEVEPFWAPNRYVAMECPEVFKWGEWWYFVYSEFTDAFTTKYRMSKSLKGPWIAPEHDSIDGRAFYAAKSTFLNNRRYFTGWIATKKNESDDGEWQWAGNIATLEATQNADGTLNFKFPNELVTTFKNTVATSIENTTLNVPDGYDCSLTGNILPNRATYIKAELEFSMQTHEVGFLLRASNDGDSAYMLRLEPKRARVVFDRWPRKKTGTEQWQISGDVPYYVELERPCELLAGKHTVEILIEGTIMVAVIDKSVSLSARIYDKESGRFGFFVSDGQAKLTSLEIKDR